MTIRDNLSQLYYNWLTTELISVDPSFINVVEILFSRDYVPIMNMDESRKQDGKHLRDQFMAKYEGRSAIILGSSPWDDECSMLEMMIGLSVRMKQEFFFEDDDIFDVNTILFENMLMSLCIKPSSTSEEVNEIIDIFLMRQYDATGRGSLFDLTNKTSDIDWRIPPIWNQMLAWVSTTHGIYEE